MTRFNEPWRINPEHPSVIEDCNGTSIVNAEPRTAARIVVCVNLVADMLKPDGFFKQLDELTVDKP